MSETLNAALYWATDSIAPILAQYIDEKKDIVEVQPEFTLRLLRECMVENDGLSVILSPFSVSVCLAMVCAGARRRTLAEMIRLLATGNTSDELHMYFNRLIRWVDGEQCVNAANKLFATGLRAKENFISVLRHNCKSDLGVIDFRDAERAAKEICDFVRECTNGKIDNIISASRLRECPSEQALILVNAVYFKAQWFCQFDAHRTTTKKFYESRDSTLLVDMMSQSEAFKYYDDDLLQAVELGYCAKREDEKQAVHNGDERGDVSMFIFLPRERYGLEQMLQQINGSRLLAVMNSMDDRKVDLELPKFKVESDFELSKTLRKLGVTSAFCEHTANFSGMASTNTAGLYISDVVHKAFIEVDEKGTEAAAATYIGIEWQCARPDPEPAVFHADHPFFYVIANRQRDILFSGVVRGGLVSNISVQERRNRRHQQTKIAKGFRGFVRRFVRN